MITWLPLCSLYVTVVIRIVYMSYFSHVGTPLRTIYRTELELWLVFQWEYLYLR